MVLVNGVLISNALTSSDHLNDFGFWKIENGNITLTTEDLSDATLDLIVENWGRSCYGNIYYQFKGLVDANQVFLNDEELSSWTIYPLEFKQSWNKNLADWGSVDESQSGPALYKATLTIDDDDITDTFIDMRGWVRGFVIVNGIVLGRYASGLGPQQTIYLPGPWLQKGDNEIIVFEHSLQPGSQIAFSKDSIFNTP
jgi:beta-galactosidase